MNNEIVLAPTRFADRGVGDTAARLIHATRLDKLAEAYTQLTGRPCNCGARQEALNKAFPYKIKP